MGIINEGEEAKQDAHDKQWALGDYVNNPCPQCGRHRLCVCSNGKHRCEKCDWCPEYDEYAPSTPWLEEEMMIAANPQAPNVQESSSASGVCSDGVLGNSVDT